MTLLQEAIQAVRLNDVSTLRTLYSKGIKFDETVMNEAAKYGQLDAIKYLHSVNTRWSVTTTDMCVFSGCLECLKYLHEHGCKWDEQACTVAIINNKVDCLSYLLQHGCEVSRNCRRIAATVGNINCLVLVLKKMNERLNNLDLISLLMSESQYKKDYKINWDNLDVRKFLFDLYNSLSLSPLKVEISNKMDEIQSYYQAANDIVGKFMPVVVVQTYVCTYF